jgi:hypothetical protein
MTMAKAKKKNPEYKLIEKRSKRWSVLGKDGKYINGEEKVKILLAEGKFKVAKAKKKVEEPVAEVAAEEVAAKEAPAEEVVAEEAPAEEVPAEEDTEEKAE